jgi:phosphoheptose isomerase
MSSARYTHPHLAALGRALDDFAPECARLERWGAQLAEVLLAGGRVLVAGNGGSAAHAQHLSGELTGRFRAERVPLAAIALHTDTTAVTAIANDYGYEQVFARQVAAHGRPGDVFLGISTSGTSANVVAAAQVARREGLVVWALTGPPPNRLLGACDDAVAVRAPGTPTVQEVHQVAVHLLCAAIDGALTEPIPSGTGLAGARR